MLNPARGFETSVGQKSVVANRDTLSKNVDSQQHGKQADPREKIRVESQQAKQVHPHDCPEVETV